MLTTCRKEVENETAQLWYIFTDMADAKLELDLISAADICESACQQQTHESCIVRLVKL